MTNNPNADMKSVFPGANMGSLGNQPILPNISGMNPGMMSSFMPGGMEADAFNYSYYQVRNLITFKNSLNLLI